MRTRPNPRRIGSSNSTRGWSAKHPRAKRSRETTYGKWSQQSGENLAKNHRPNFYERQRRRRRDRDPIRQRVVLFDRSGQKTARQRNARPSCPMGAIRARRGNQTTKTPRPGLAPRRDPNQMEAQAPRSSNKAAQSRSGFTRHGPVRLRPALVRRVRAGWISGQLADSPQQAAIWDESTIQKPSPPTAANGRNWRNPNAGQAIRNHQTNHRIPQARQTLGDLRSTSLGQTSSPLQFDQ
jgi:hypothetical protein